MLWQGEKACLKKLKTVAFLKWTFFLKLTLTLPSLTIALFGPLAPWIDTLLSQREIETGKWKVIFVWHYLYDETFTT